MNYLLDSLLKLRTSFENEDELLYVIFYFIYPYVINVIYNYFYANIGKNRQSIDTYLQYSPFRDIEVILVVIFLHFSVSQKDQHEFRYIRITHLKNMWLKTLHLFESSPSFLFFVFIIFWDYAVRRPTLEPNYTVLKCDETAT